jgi:hypothetical protein
LGGVVEAGYGGLISGPFMRRRSETPER